MLSTIATSALGFAAKDLAAGAKRANVKAQASSEFAYGLPGNIAPAGDFDPAVFLQGKSELEVMRLREAEITHGRVGMLAAAGFLVQEKFHPLFTADGGPAIEQIPKLPVPLWFGMTLAIGIAETVRIQAGWANPFDGEMALQEKAYGEPKTAFPKEETSFQRLRPGYTPGDLGFDPLGLKPEDPAEFRIMQEKELSHGRLAMLAAAGFMAQEAVSGTTWSQQDVGFENFLLGAELSKMAGQ